MISGTRCWLNKDTLCGDVCSAWIQLSEYRFVFTEDTGPSGEGWLEHLRDAKGASFLRDIPGKGNCGVLRAISQREE